MTNSKTTKKALTASVVSLVLCFLMLLGATFAWFTDTATTTVNKIQAGTLEVDIEQYTADGWQSVDGKEIDFVNEEGKTMTNILWEPGATFNLPTLHVANNGSLALKYKATFSAVSGNTKLAEVIDVLLNGEKVGTLSDLLNSTDSDGFAHGNLNAKADSGELHVSLRMQESAGNDYQGLSIDGVVVTVYATQDTVESDSTGNQYDKDATSTYYVYNLTELRNAVKASGNNAKIVLMDDIMLSSNVLYEINDTYGYCFILVKTSLDIDLNGHIISYTRNAENGDANARFGIVATKGATVNIYDSSVNQIGGIVIDDAEGYCLDNKLISSGYVLYAEDGATLNIHGGNYETSNSVVVYARIGGNINIYGGTYKSSYYPGGEGILLNILNGTESINKIYVYGGSFEKFQPGTNNKTEAILADGYNVEQNGDWYTVVKNN